MRIPKLQLQKGRPDNYEGNLIVYSSVRKNGRREILARYATVNPEEYKKKAECSQKKLETIIANISVAEPSDGNGHVFIAEVGPLKSKDELPVDNNDDVIYAGAYKCRRTAESALENAVKLYVQQYTMQQSIKKLKQLTSKNTPTQTYEDVNESEIRNSAKAYVVQMGIAKTSAQFEMAWEAFEQFSKGSRFEGVAYQLSKMVCGQRISGNYKGIDDYLDLIQALHLEKFQEAEIIKKRISKMEGSR